MSTSPDQPITRYEHMVELSVWTNRLDRVLQARLNELKTGFNKCIRNLEAVLKTLPADSEQAKTLNELRGYCDSILRNVYPELIEMYVHAADSAFARDSQLLALREQLAQSAPKKKSLRKLVAAWLRRLTSAFFSTNSNAQTESTNAPTNRQILPSGRFPNCAAQDVAHGLSVNNYEDVNNEGTPFSLFDTWQTVYHFEGRRFGSNRPILSDHLEHIFGIHQHIDLKGKRVLELGPFEGANTKQLVDMGAKEVVGIEANGNAFLKCLIVKNQFRLNNVELIYGDCLKVLADSQFRSRGWFDLCYASGILYHMKDPLYFIDLITATAPAIYIWTQYASEEQPKGDWAELRDGENRSYTARWNSYNSKEHWGGVAEGAFWLTKESIHQAFADRGFQLTNVALSENAIGKVISFIAKRCDVL